MEGLKSEVFNVRQSLPPPFFFGHKATAVDVDATIDRFGSKWAVPKAGNLG